MVVKVVLILLHARAPVVQRSHPVAGVPGIGVLSHADVVLHPPLQVAGCDKEVTEDEVEAGEVDQLAQRLCQAVEVRAQ